MEFEFVLHSFLHWMPVVAKKERNDILEDKT